MLTLGAREAKNEFGRLLDAAQSESVLIEKKGRPVAVVLSVKKYQLLEDAQDKLWEILAKTSDEFSFKILASSFAVAFRSTIIFGSA